MDTSWESFTNNPAYKTLLKYKDTVFKPDLPGGLPKKRDIEHRIDVKDPSLQMYRQQWRLSPEQRVEIDSWVYKMVKTALIRPSISPHAAPTFCVRKPVGWRIVHDYRQLNENTVRQSVPMTRKEDVFDAMAGGYYFSTMDLMSAYYQIRMKEDHIKYTAFQAPNGLWEYLVLPMGVSNAPATMHRLTTELFKNLNHTKAYYDDIYIFTKTKDINEHLQALDEVLKILEENQLFVKISKCVFCAEEIPCLGDFIGRNGVRIDPDKVKTIREWPVPKTQDDLHSFLGLTGYVQRFCHHYAELTGPLFDLLKKKDKKNSKIVFGDKELKLFEELKSRLSDTPVLHVADFSLPMRLRTDASNFAIGGVLFQIIDGEERPIAFTSRKMKKAELNYPTQQQELLAIVHSLTTFRIYCLDQPPIVDTDHCTLQTIFTQKTANRRLARWYDLLAEYQPKFQYYPGKDNYVAETLSRRPDLKPTIKEFHEIKIPSFNDTCFTMALSTLLESTDLKKNIINSYKKDKKIQEILKAINLRNNSTRNKEKKKINQKSFMLYSYDNDLLWYQTPTDEEPRIVIPNDIKLKNLVISEAHDTNYGGHPGTERTYLNLCQLWYWGKMVRSIQKYIHDCESCRRNKPRLTREPGLLEPLRIPEDRWSDISMDFITDLPETTNGYNAILVIVDRLTKRVILIPTIKKLSAEACAQLFLKHVWKDHGIPKSIVSDRDPKFLSGFWTTLFKTLGTKLKMTTAYRAQGDGQTERMNRTLEEYLRAVVGPNQETWDTHIATAQFVMNSTVNNSIKMIGI